MSLASLAAGIVLTQQAPLRQITFQDDLFTINGPEGKTNVSLNPGFEPMNTATGRLWLPVADHVLTFDSNGIGFRKNNKSTYATYNSIATSDKLFTKEQRDQINRDVAAGTKKLEVSAVSGWEKVNDTAFIILRWDDKAGKPWLEALMRFDFPKGKPTVTYLGRFDSFTQATGRVNDKLIFENGELSTVTHSGDVSLLESYSIESKSFTKSPLGANFVDAKLVPGSLSGLGIQRTPAQTYIVSLIDRETKTSQAVGEIRGEIAGLYAPSVLHYKSNGRSILFSLSSGSEIVIPNDCGIESINSGILLWTPAQKPKAAALYSSTSFRTLARWSQP
ncbi:hypothetical protein C0431_04395 [bacterium]|nr:hypothetical protein [bacterium]